MRSKNQPPPPPPPPEARGLVEDEAEDDGADAGGAGADTANGGGDTAPVSRIQPGLLAGLPSQPARAVAVAASHADAGHATAGQPEGRGVAGANKLVTHSLDLLGFVQPYIPTLPNTIFYAANSRLSSLRPGGEAGGAEQQVVQREGPFSAANFQRQTLTL